MSSCRALDTPSMCTEKDTTYVHYRKLQHNTFPLHHENAGTYSYFSVCPAVGMGERGGMGEKSLFLILTSVMYKGKKEHL